MSLLRRASARRLLDVVVPAYNVSAYLDSCLASIAANTSVHTVVIVDDGSTDDTAEVARRWVAADRRFRLIQQENHGLGHARNTGLRSSEHRYVAFLDSDDLVAGDIYDRMVASLEASGSDLATGAVLRLRGEATRPSAMHRGVFDRTLTATTVRQHIPLLRDRLASNKVFRRTFLDAIGFTYPEGVLYEDSAAVVPALAAAAAIDVLAEPMLLWRERDSGEPSITQDRSDSRHPRDRMSQVLAAAHALRSTPDLKATYERGVLQDDLLILLRWFPRVDDDWRRTFADGVRAFLAACEPGVIATAPAEIRLFCHLLVAGDLEPLVEEMADPDRSRDIPIVITPAGSALLDHPLRASRTIPDEVLEAAAEPRIRSGLFDLRQDGATLVVDGWAFLDRVAADAAGAVHTAVWLEHPGGARLPATVEQRFEPRVGSRHGRAIDVGWSGFTATFDLTDLAPAAGKQPWTLWVEAAAGPIRRAGRLRFPRDPSARLPTVEQPIGNGRWAHPVRRDDGSIVVRVLRRSVEVASASLEADELRLTLNDARGRQLPESGFQLRGGDGLVVPLPASRPSAATIEVVVAAATIPPGSWGVWLSADDDIRLRTAPEFVAADGHTGSSWVRVRRTTFGNARVVVGPPRPTVRTATWTEQATLDLTLEHAVGDLVVRSEEPDEAWRFAIEDGQCRIPAGGIDRFGFPIPLRARTWRLEATDIQGTVHTVDLDHTVHRLPITTRHDDRDYSLVVDGEDGAHLVIGPDIAPEEQGRHAQHRLQQIHLVTARPAEADTVFYECYGGRSFVDSPRAIHDALVARGGNWRHAVEVDDRRFRPPPTARGVARGSEDFYATLGSAETVVSNAFLPTWYRGHHTTVHTGHGQAYKHMGTDLQEATARGRRTHDEQRALAATWTHLISPSPYMSELLRRTWSYEGNLLETGYPRNDVFFSPGRETMAATVRQRLGIPPGCRVVLYAPTFRDDVVYRGFKARLDLRLDIDRAAAAWGPDTVLLFRQHYFVVDRLEPTERVIDVADYPDVQELLLITDVLVTDYSSIMFDFAVTGRPMVFFAYDLDHYERTRGAYFDLRQAAPGPVVYDSDAVIEAVAAADHDVARHADRYLAFRQRHCPWDDGGATERVIAAVFPDA